MRVQTYLFPFLLLVFIIGWSFALYQFGPSEVVALLGIENGYVIAGLLGFLGGVSTFFTLPYHFVIVTLASGGLQPIFLGLITAVGVFLGDSISYFIGYHGRSVLPSRIADLFHRLYLWCQARRGMFPLFLFIYAAFIPFSNDFMLISLGLARYPYWKLMVPLALGTLVFNTGLAFFGAYGIYRFFM